MSNAATDIDYPPNRTALLLVDPYNDFLAEGGKLWPMVAQVANSVRLHDNLRAIQAAVRKAKWPVVFVPHHRAEPDDFVGWTNPTPYQLGAAKLQVFAKGSWGGSWHPDFTPAAGDAVAKEHWGGNGFGNTDLDYLLKQHNISHIVLVGLIANTCIESTARAAADLGCGPRSLDAHRSRRGHQKQRVGALHHLRCHVLRGHQGCGRNRLFSFQILASVLANDAKAREVTKRATWTAGA